MKPVLMFLALLGLGGDPVELPKELKAKPEGGGVFKVPLNQVRNGIHINNSGMIRKMRKEAGRRMRAEELRNPRSS